MQDFDIRPIPEEEIYRAQCYIDQIAKPLGAMGKLETLAARLRHWQENSRRLALIIGGPEGVTADIKALADESWSLGKLTLPHPLVRIIVAEALYRAWSINHNHPYHRA